MPTPLPEIVEKECGNGFKTQTSSNVPLGASGRESFTQKYSAISQCKNALHATNYFFKNLGFKWTFMGTLSTYSGEILWSIRAFFGLITRGSILSLTYISTLKFYTVHEAQ